MLTQSDAVIHAHWSAILHPTPNIQCKLCQLRKLLTIAAPGFSVDELERLTVLGERVRLGRRLLLWRCRAA